MTRIGIAAAVKPFRLAPPQVERPVAINAICAACLLGAVFGIPMVFFGAVGFFGDWFPRYLEANWIVAAICVLGLWRMRRWPLVVFGAAMLANEALFVAAGVWNPYALGLPGLIFAIGLAYLPQGRQARGRQASPAPRSADLLPD